MPLPLPMMIPFMGIQSAIMAWQFGTNFQAGKRWISAMDNNTFNKLTPQSLMIDNTNAIREMIPTMQESLGMMTPLVKSVILEFGKMITEAFDVLNPFKDANGFNFWDPEFNIFTLRKNPPFTFGPTPTGPEPITPTDPHTPSMRPDLTLREVNQMSDNALAEAANNINSYHRHVQILIEQESQRRSRLTKPVIPPKIVFYSSKDEAIKAFLKTNLLTLSLYNKLKSNIRANLRALSVQKSPYKNFLLYINSEWAGAKNIFNRTNQSSTQKAIRKQQWDAITQVITEANIFVGNTVK